MGCRCKVCRSTDSRDKRLRTSALVQTEPGAPGILLDCGPDFRAQMLAADSPALACALLTHTHYDHVGGLDDLRPYSYHAPDQRFDIYCQEDVIRDIRTRIPYCFTENPYPGVPSFNISRIEAGKTFSIELGGKFKPVEITPLRVMHGKMPILGFRIGGLAYITDCSAMPDEDTLRLLQGVDTLVINGLRIATHHSHLNLSEALDVIKVINPRQAYLTHMSHDMPAHAEMPQVLPARVQMAYDGLSIDIPS